MRLRWFWVLPLAAACRSVPTTAVPPLPDPCRFVPAGPAVFDTIAIAFSERDNEGGRLLLGLTGRTLIRVDCAGRTHPGLARRWSRAQDGLAWVFELDRAIAAETVVEQWDIRRNAGLWPWSRILEVRALAPARLEVRLDTAFADVPVSLALPMLGVAPGPADSLLPAHIWIHPAGIDQRDLLDVAPAGAGRGADLLITRDPAVVSYARAKPGTAIVPLPWDRTYVMLAPTTRPDEGAALGQSLAGEVVRADARAAVGPFWWETASCRGTMPLLPMGRRPEVVYLQGDETAREIAERLVALERSPLRAVALPQDALDASLAGGEAARYVISLPRTAPGSCREVPAWPSASGVIPLVDVRAHAIVRSGVPGFTIEGDGTVRFDRPVAIIPPPGPMR